MELRACAPQCYRYNRRFSSFQSVNFYAREPIAEYSNTQCNESHRDGYQSKGAGPIAAVAHCAYEGDEASAQHDEHQAE